MTSKSRSMTIPSTFRAFRIRNDATGYRSGIESVSLDDLNPGEVVVKTATAPLWPDPPAPRRPVPLSAATREALAAALASLQEGPTGDGQS